jgi:oligoribonuclease NrnB/cAMP/cGMP phosphodiesterase (DHH superfamily)
MNLNKMKKIACVFHSIDLDGWMSAAIVKHWFMLIKSIEFIGYNYGQPIPDLSSFNNVIMCDISFPNDVMLNLANRLGKKLIWIDHHQPKIDEIAKYFVNNNAKAITTMVTDGSTKFSACELTWKFFYSNHSIGGNIETYDVMPEIVRLLGRYDCFGHSGTNEEQKVIEFQYGARSCINNYKEAYDYLQACIETPNINELNIWNKGIAIYKYLCVEAKQIYENGFSVELDESPEYRTGKILKFISINRDRFNLINFGINYHNDNYDGCMSFYLNKEKKVSVSLYNGNGKIDCSVIAKRFGGGGHPGASGFIIDLNEFNKILKLNS